jgi:hypothetical protein
MPTNKNALTRYKFLDEMLSDRHHFYDIHDLTEKCNEKLISSGLSEVTQRCIEKDINYLEYDPFFAEIERFRVASKRCLRYANPSFSIFKKELSEEESNLILEVLNTIGQFDGLAHFEWLERFKIGLGLKQRPKVISFSHNPYLQNSNLLGVLFDYRYIRIHPFEDDNGRIARLMVNYILTRHDYLMIVARSRKKDEYLDALHQTDLEVGPIPSDGAHADIKDIRPFLKYFNDLVVA